MRYRKEFERLVIVAVVVVAVALIVAYMPRFWDVGDNTPLEHELSGDPPTKFREP